ncbi:unnamed protein product, partial [marine sediment metagenome]
REYKYAEKAVCFGYFNFAAGIAGEIGVGC